MKEQAKQEGVTKEEPKKRRFQEELNILVSKKRKLISTQSPDKLIQTNVLANDEEEVPPPLPPRPDDNVDLKKEEAASLPIFFTPKIKTLKTDRLSQTSATKTQKSNVHNNSGIFRATDSIRFSPNSPKTPEGKSSQSSWQNSAVNTETPLWSKKK